MAIVRKKAKVSNGRLTQLGIKFRTYEACWGNAVFECECGNTTVLSISDVSRGLHNSCGCLRKEKLLSDRIKRILSGSKLTQYSLTKIAETVVSMDTGTEYMYSNTTTHTYVLELEDGCWYVGRTDNPNVRFKKHVENPNVAWIRLHPVMKIHSLTPGNTERQTTLKMMKKYGWDKVRGYTWCRVEMLKPPLPLALIK